MPSTLDRLIGGAVGPFVQNASATRDPTITDDSTAGYQAGSMWMNTAPGALRVWMCRANTAGAASWQYVGADFANGGGGPPGETTDFGQGSGSISAMGITTRTLSAGTPCGGSGADIVMGIISIPGNSFDIAGRGVNILCQGSFGGNTNSKRLKIIAGPAAPVLGSGVVGGTIIADTLGVTASGSGWMLGAGIRKIGAAGSNTQVGFMTGGQTGATTPPLLLPTALTLTENAAILVVFTANPVTLPGDVSLNLMETYGIN